MKKVIVQRSLRVVYEFELVKQQDSLPNIAKLSNILKYERN
jgi:hypothetical protein